VTIVRWHGHACFEIVANDGRVIVIDPHDGHSIGLKPPKVEADIVLITHNHYDHNAYNVVAKPSAKLLVMAKGEQIIDGIRVKGVEAFHDKVGGKRRGRVVMYRIEVDGVAFVHLGDLGHVLDESLARELKPIDVLMIPVGGTFTIEPDEAWQVVKVLEPRCVIPMHYWVKGLMLPLKTLDEFLKHVEDWNIVRLERNEFVVSKNNVPERTVVIFPEPS